MNSLRETYKHRCIILENRTKKWIICTSLKQITANIYLCSEPPTKKPCRSPPPSDSSPLSCSSLRKLASVANLKSRLIINTEEKYQK
ncbi:hypothetical protein Y032_0629g842 [Ancylostoma ceylanicum]|uniref:Uncharacterized protein n=1 Tax=Ancylostoma ceylanicum TaxID=53326 RepID=A0A016WM71_9BILA|nr:hypothetical protein Y032_0629g842 [Ancylostoma ceylanicum]